MNDIIMTPNNIIIHYIENNTLTEFSGLGIASPPGHSHIFNVGR